MFLKYRDIEPSYADEIKLSKKSLIVDSSKLLNKLQTWLDSGIVPILADNKAMLLNHQNIISQT
jgi:hypothetical protein